MDAPRAAAKEVVCSALPILYVHYRIFIRVSKPRDYDHLRRDPIPATPRFGMDIAIDYFSIPNQLRTDSFAILHGEKS